MTTKVQELQPVSAQNNNKTDDTADPDDQSATQPIILHFIQEASKLAVPSHRSLVDSTFDPYTSDTRDAHASNNASDAYSQHSWAQTFANNQEEKSDMYMITTHAGPNQQGSNPWEVMSLINLQCEKLLHHREHGESDCTATSFSSSNSTAYPSPLELDDTWRGRGDLRCASPAVVPHDDAPLCLPRRGEESSCISPATHTTGDSGQGSSESPDNGPVQRCVTDAKASSLAEPQHYDGRPLPADPNAVLHSQSAHRAAMEVKLSVVTGSEWGGSGSKEGSISAERGPRGWTSSDEALPQTHLSPATDGALGNVAEQPAHRSDKVVCLARRYFNAVDPLPTDAAVALDFNSNLLLTFDPLGDAHTSPSTPKQPVWAILRNEELSQNKSQPHGRTAVPECIKDHNALQPLITQQSHFKWIRDAETTAPPQCLPSSRAEEDLHTPAGPQRCPSTSSTCRARTRRKQAHPTRSADATDPDFQGVMFRMRGELDHSRGQCRLLVTSKYRISSSHRRKPRLRTRSSQSSLRTSSSDEDPDLSTGLSKSRRSKECASCCTKKTPMWRDAEDGTPLCNACGIRYKKYKVRCDHCWHIPRKEGNTSSCCPKCGNSVWRTSALRKHTVPW